MDGWTALLSYQGNSDGVLMARRKCLSFNEAMAEMKRYLLSRGSNWTGWPEELDMILLSG